MGEREILCSCLMIVFQNAKWLWLLWVVAAGIVGSPPEYQLLELLQSARKDGGGGGGEMEDERGMVRAVEDVPNLGRCKMFSCMRVGISVSVVAVVLVGAVGVICFGAHFLSEGEVDCLGRLEGEIFELGGDFVIVVVKVGMETFELVPRCGLRLDLGFWMGGVVYDVCVSCQLKRICSM